MATYDVHHDGFIIECEGDTCTKLNLIVPYGANGDPAFVWKVKNALNIAELKDAIDKWTNV